MLFVACLAFLGCEKPQKAKEDNELETVPAYLVTNFNVVVLDGHEYIVFCGARRGGICHKQNCKFCEEEKRKMGH